MFKKTIEYEDYDGNKRKEDFYFHLNKAEVVEWLTTSGGYTLDKIMLKLAREQNMKEIFVMVKDLITRSYGEKSLDGRRFVKSAELTEAFIQTEAYATMFMELVGDGIKMAEFVSKILPADMSEEIDKTLKEHPDGIPDELKDLFPKTE